MVIRSLFKLLFLSFLIPRLFCEKLVKSKRFKLLHGPQHIELRTWKVTQLLLLRPSLRLLGINYLKPKSCSSPSPQRKSFYKGATAKHSSAGGLDGWAWNEIKAISWSWFVGLALFSCSVEAAGEWRIGCIHRHDSQRWREEHTSGAASALCSPCGLLYLGFCQSLASTAMVLPIFGLLWRLRTPQLWILKKFSATPTRETFMSLLPT